MLVICWNYTEMQRGQQNIKFSYLSFTQDPAMQRFSLRY
jgi:hypothetical protein